MRRGVEEAICDVVLTYHRHVMYELIGLIQIHSLHSRLPYNLHLALVLGTCAGACVRFCLGGRGSAQERNELVRTREGVRRNAWDWFHRERDLTQPCAG